MIHKTVVLKIPLLKRLFCVVGFPKVGHLKAGALRSATACLLMVALTGCGGGGSGPVTRDPDTPDAGPPDIPIPDTTTGLRRAATDVLDVWAPGGVAAYTTLSVVPTTGSARYAGFVYGDLSGDRDAVTDSVIGQLTLNVAFTATSAGFTGAATDFVDVRDDPFTGALTISGGALNRAGNPASDATLRGVTLAGVLRDAENVAYDFGIQLEGDFLGPTANAIGGEALGRVRVGGDDQDFDGGFIAAQ